MVTIDQSADRLAVTYVPRLHLGFYILFLLAAIILAARAALQGDIVLARLTMLLGGGISIAAILLFIETSTITLDRPAGVVRLSGRSVFSRRESTLPLADLVQAMNDSPFAKDRGTSHRPALLLRDGTIVQTRRVYISRRMSHRIIGAVNDWLAAGQSAARD